MSLDDILQKLQELRQAGSVSEVLMDPVGRMLAAGVLGLVLLLLIFVQPTSKEQQNQSKAPRPKREPRGYTRAEIAQHKSEDDLWIIIRHKDTDKLNVYDVTDYIEHHPGGDAIFTHAGDDCTPGFRGPQHPPTVWELVEEYCIGWVQDA